MFSFIVLLLSFMFNFRSSDFQSLQEKQDLSTHKRSSRWKLGSPNVQTKHREILDISWCCIQRWDMSRISWCTTRRKRSIGAKIHWQKLGLRWKRLNRRRNEHWQERREKNIVKGTFDVWTRRRWQRVTVNIVFANMVNTLALGNCQRLIVTSQTGYCRLHQIHQHTWTTEAASADLLMMPSCQNDHLWCIKCVAKS